MSDEEHEEVKPPPEGAGSDTEPGADEGFQRLLDLLDVEHNLDLREYKEASLLRRFRRRLDQVRVATFADYIRVLEHNSDEYRALLDVILINVTGFFRDPDAWAVLRDDVLPRVVDEATAVKSVRLWSAGCSSGEEPYTVAMLLAECMRAQRCELDVKIYATDIDEDALVTARAGLYRLDQLKDVPPELLDRYFTADGAMYRLARDLRKWCIFGRHDLTQDSQLSHIDLLLCRNVLIYFDRELQDRILPRFHYAIRDRGYLFLGKSEAMLGRSQAFAPVDVKWRIFQRMRTSDARARLPLNDNAALSRVLAPPARDDVLAEWRFQALVDTLEPAVMVIAPDDSVISWSPAAERLYEIPAETALGKKFRDLDVSYRLEGVRARIEEVKATQGRTRMTDVPFARRSGKVAHVAVSVGPVNDDRGRLAGVLVVADDLTELANLREEISRISEQAATANEELQSTNEELETTNEELQSTNEELETTIEELQAINTELGTLNTELEKRSAELTRLAVYHRAVLDAIDESVLVLDERNIVRTWNQAAARTWGVRPEEVLDRDFLSLPVGDTAPAAREVLKRVREQRVHETLPGIEYTFPDRGKRDATLHLSPLAAPDGTLLGVLGVAIPDPVPSGAPKRRRR